MTRLMTTALAALASLSAMPGGSFAQDADDEPKVTRASKDVPELILCSAQDSFTVNQKDFELIAGQGYRWKITSAAGLEYKFATDLFRNVFFMESIC